MQDFKNLNVWQKSHLMTVEVYRKTMNFPDYEIYGLTSQIRRASVSIGSNIAEGCGRTENDFSRFLQISFASACEVEYQILLAHDLTYINQKEYENVNDKLTEIKRMLAALIQKTKESEHPKAITEH